MTQEQIRHIQRSWRLILKRADQVGQMFYARLFEASPELRPMFQHVSIDMQVKKLMSMLDVVIRRIEALDAIKDDIAQLSQRHVRYGVQEEHFSMVGGALLWTLEQCLGREWTKGMKDAWVNLYTLLSNAMVGNMKGNAPIHAVVGQ